MKKMVRKRKLKRSLHRGGFLGIAGVLCMLFITLLVQGNKLERKNIEYKKTEANLEKQIEAEEKRTQDNEELSKYMQTKEYYEKEAKEKLGLVYEDEIIFKSED